MRSFTRRRSVLALIQSAAFVGLGTSAAHASDWASATAGGDWNTATNWTNPQDVPDTVGETANIGVGTVNRAFNLSANATISQLTYANQPSGNTTNMVTSTSTAIALTFDAPGAGPAHLDVTGLYGGSIAVGSNIHQITAPVVLTDTLDINVSPRSADYSGIVMSFRGSGLQFITGPGGVIKDGLGTLVFADTAKAFQGPLVVNQGRLRFNAAGGLSQTSSVTVHDGGEIVIEQTTPITFGASASVPVILDGFGTANPPTGSGNHFPGAIRTGTNLTQTFNNLITLAGDTSINQVGSTGSLTLANTISGPGKLYVMGQSADSGNQGQLIVNQPNTYYGGTFCSNGTYVISGATANAGSGDVEVNGVGSYTANQGTTFFTGKMQIQSSVTDAIKNSAALTLTGDGGQDGLIGGWIQVDSTNETVGGLVLGGVTQTTPGTYGSTSSSATFKNDAYFHGSGTVTLALTRSLYWDTNNVAANGGGATPTGTWGGTALSFNTDSTGGASGTVTNKSLSTDPVIFTAGSDGTGTYTVTVSGTQNAASLSVARGTVTLSGGTIANAGGTYDVANGATAKITSTLSTATLNKTGAGKLVLTRIAENHNVTINGGTIQIEDSSPTLPAFPSGQNSAVSRPGSMIAIANDGAPLGTRAYTATLDLGNNDLIIDYTGSSPFASVQDMVRSGFNFGDWLGKGITSSTAANPMSNGNYALGVAENGQLTNPFGNDDPNDPNSVNPKFDDQTVDNTTVLVKFTHRVDLDLNGLVDGNDAAIFNGSFSEGDGGATWQTGDVDYDGVYSSNDAAIFNSFYDESLGHLPEPGSLSLLGAAAALGVARRRRR